jgi:hypothetical protein
MSQGDSSLGMFGYSRRLILALVCWVIPLYRRIVGLSMCELRGQIFISYAFLGGCRSVFGLLYCGMY